VITVIFVSFLDNFDLFPDKYYITNDNHEFIKKASC
jgi:hypothetical protein